jgi:hypothetical protein
MQVGEWEKLVRALVVVAGARQPLVIFIDEVISLLYYLYLFFSDSFCQAFDHAEVTFMIYIPATLGYEGDWLDTLYRLTALCQQDLLTRMKQVED